MRSRWPLFATCIALLTIAFVPNAFAEFGLNMTKGVTPVSEKVYNLHMIILWICCGIGTVVYGLMIYSIWRHRKSVGYQAATFHESTAVEIMWSIIPFVILLSMAIPATYTLVFMDNVEESDLSVKVTGYRWYWRYDYVDQNVGFFSYLSTPEDQRRNIAPKGEHYLLEVDKPLVLPVGKKVRFLVTSNDVQHAWWVPALAIKKDAIPGFINEIWATIKEPGTYRGQCAELCGAEHGFMPIVVKALPEAEFQTWLEEQQKTKVGMTHNMTTS